MRVYIIVLLLVALAPAICAGTAAQPAGPGVWRTYTNSNCLSDLMVAGDYVWGATCAGLIRWDRTNGHYVRYTTADGLAGNHITAMASDTEGRVWVGAAGRVSGFDGQRWTTYPVSKDWADAEIRVIAAGPAGQLWVGTPKGVKLFDGQTWHTYTAAEGLEDTEVRAIAIDGAGHPWVAVGHTQPTGSWYGSGLSMFDGQTWHSYTAADGLAGNWVTAIAIDGAGQPWIGTRYGGVSAFDGRAWQTYTFAEDLAGNIVDALAIDQAGHPWVASRYKGLSQFDGQRWTTYTLPENLVNDLIQDLAIDSTGQVWLSTLSSVNAFDGQRWTTYAVANDLPDNQIQAIVTDAAGQLWVGATGGVSRFDGQAWTAYAAAADLASPNVNAIALGESGQIWVGAGEGLSMFDGQRWTTYTTADGLVSNDITAIALDAAGQVWVGTSRGISAFDGQTWTTYTTADGLVDDIIKAIAIDPAGQVWVGTSGGLSAFDGQAWTTYTNNWVSGVALDSQGHVWISTSNGVSVYDGQSWTTYMTGDGLPDNFATAITSDGAGRIWAGTMDGLTMFDGQGWTTYTAADGLIEEEVSAIVADGAGQIWVGFGGFESRGVSVFDGQRWTTYTVADGLVDKQVRGITVDTAGRLWFATADGVSMFDPQRQPIPPTPAPSEPATPPSLSQPATPAGPVEPASMPEQVDAPPPLANLHPTAPPAQPLRAWTVATDGAVFVLDRDNHLYQLDPADLTPLAQSAPLFQAQPEKRVHLLADQTYLFAGNETITQTLILDRADFSEIARLDQAGPIALDPGKHLFLGSQDVFNLPPYTGELLIYDLAELSRPPQAIQTQCLANPLLAEPVSRRLYVKTRTCLGSPPHQGDLYHIYDLDTLEEVGVFQPDPYRGYLGRPAMAERAGFGVTVNSGLSSVNDFYFFDPQGRTLHIEEGTDYGGVPAIEANGAWIYLRLERGLMALRSSDLSVQSFLPFTRTVPVDLALSPDDETLYLFGNDWLTALPTTELQALGMVPLSPFPLAWTQEENQHTYLYRSPDMDKDGMAFVQLTPTQLPSNAASEIYRTNDGGRSWRSLPVLEGYGIPALSLSPEFATDQTLVAGNRRSTDAGETWTTWTPRIAFTSDRDGNREIYTMDEYYYTADEYEVDLQRLTDNPAADENPAWSPAWTWLAFQSQRSGNWDIFSLRAECDPPKAECELRQLTGSPADDLLPAWSPDGQTIAFVSMRDGNPEIYLMDKNGENQRRLTFHPGGDWRPAWLPDSQHLVFTSDRGGNNDIYLVAVPPEGTPLTSEPALTPVVTGPADDRDPAVSIAGTLAFLSDREGFMRTYTLDLRKADAPVEAHAETDQAEAHPSWLDHDSLLVTVERAGEVNIYEALYEYTRHTTSPGFDGQPAGGPVWWQPDETASLEWLNDRE